MFLNLFSLNKNVPIMDPRGLRANNGIENGNEQKPRAEREKRKSAKIDHVANWYFGNFCSRCARIDSEEERYGRGCWNKIQKIAAEMKSKGIDTITHKEFSVLIRSGTTFCKPIRREFNECPICKFFERYDKKR